MTKFLTIAAIFTLAFFVFVPQTWASVFYLSPDNVTVSKGSTFSVQVKLDTQSDVVNGVSAYLAFSADKLEVADIKGNEEVLPIEAEETTDGGVIKISRANLSSVSGDVKVATITFKAKENGTAQITFIPGSAAPKTIDSSDSLNLSSSKGMTVTINDSSDGNPGPGSTDKPQPSKPPRCDTKQNSNKNQMSIVTASLSATRSRLDTIYALVDDYYVNILVPGGKSSSAYTTQRQQVDTKRNQAIQQIDKLKTDVASFSCSMNNPRDVLNQIKKEAQSAKSALNDYKSALKTLISTLRNIK